MEFPVHFSLFQHILSISINLAQNYPFAKPSCESSSGSRHRSVNSYSFDYTVSVLVPHCSLTQCRAPIATMTQFSLIPVSLYAY